MNTENRTKLSNNVIAVYAKKESSATINFSSTNDRPEEK